MTVDRFELCHAVFTKQFYQGTGLMLICDGGVCVYNSVLGCVVGETIFILIFKNFNFVFFFSRVLHVMHCLLILVV